MQAESGRHASAVTTTSDPLPPRANSNDDYISCETTKGLSDYSYRYARPLVPANRTPFPDGFAAAAVNCELPP